MKRWLTLVAVLCLATATALPAQQARTPAPQTGVSAPLSGPRLRPEFARVDVALPDSSVAVRSATSTAAAGRHTITITTLALVLIVILAVVLIAD